MTDHPDGKEIKQSKSGSPKTGEPLSIAIGRIRRPHGVKGEVIYEPYPEYSFSLNKGKMIMIGKKKEAYSIRSIRSMDRNSLIAFDGLETCDDVAFMRNQLVYVSTSDLKERGGGEKYPHQVLGMTVVDETGKKLGVLEEVLLTGANDVYLVKTPEDEEILLPAIASVIVKVDAEKKTITVHQPVWE
jgi:16S rRNA processing protein RimM